MNRIDFWRSMFLSEMRKNRTETEARATADAALIASDERDGLRRAPSVKHWFSENFPKWFRWDMNQAIRLQNLWRELEEHRHEQRLRGVLECTCADCDTRRAEATSVVDAFLQQCEDERERRSRKRAERRAQRASRERGVN